MALRGSVAHGWIDRADDEFFKMQGFLNAKNNGECDNCLADFNLALCFSWQAWKDKETEMCIEHFNSMYVEITSVEHKAEARA